MAWTLARTGQLASPGDINSYGFEPPHLLWSAPSLPHRLPAASGILAVAYVLRDFAPQAASMRKLFYDRTNSYLIGRLILLGLMLMGCFGLRPTDGVSRDDWRRTAEGWERVSDWNSSGLIRRQSANLSPGLSPANGPRYDSHPAALALAEIVLVVFGFYAFPAPRITATESRSWQTRLLGSFRASAFGG